MTRIQEGKGPGFPTGETREGHFGSVGAEWTMEFVRKSRKNSYIQRLAMTHHAEARKVLHVFHLTCDLMLLYTHPVRGRFFVTPFLSQKSGSCSPLSHIDSLDPPSCLLGGVEMG
jgi:hypothetical protein